MKALLLIFILSLGFSAAHAEDDDETSCDDSLATELVSPEAKKEKKKKKKVKVKAVTEPAKKSSISFFSFDEEKAKLREQIKTIVADNNDPRSNILRDILHTNFIVSLKSGPNAHWAVALLIGNADVQYNQKEIEGIEKLAAKIKEYGYLIVHDANSEAAPIIAKAAGDYSVAIGTSETPESVRAQLKNFTIIDDPYLRLKAFGKMDHVSFSPDSVAGMALMVNGDTKSHVPFARSEFKARPGDWVPSLSEPQLGFPKYKGMDVIALEKRQKKADPSPFDIDKALADYFLTDLEKSLGSANQIVEGLKKIQEETKGIHGALVIGSSKFPGSYTDVLYDTVKLYASHGMPITTGGAGGVMEVANAAAFDAGASSIGVPIVGESSLKGEKNIPDKIHTLTLKVIGYTARLPLLTNNKKLIIVAPGGSGTMKEIAVLLMRQSLKPDPQTVFLFLGKKYYGSFVEGLKKSLSPVIANNLLLADSAKEAVELTNALSETIWKDLDYSKLWIGKKQTPRNDNEKFKEPVLEPLGKKWTFGW